MSSGRNRARARGRAKVKERAGAVQDPPPSEVEELSQNPNARKRRVQLAWVAEVVLAAIGTGLVAWTGVSGLPVLAIVALSVAIYAALAFVTKALVGEPEGRVTALWASVVTLSATLIGVLVYGGLAQGVPFVNYVANQDVTLSPTAGAPPRVGDQYVLAAGEEHSAYCYVDVKGRTWLFFKGNVEDGWAPLSDFHLPPEAHHSLPGSC